MKLIHKGQLPGDRVWRGECEHCHSIFEAVQRELAVHSDQRDGEWGEAKCPQCHGRILFYPKVARPG